MIEFRGLKKRFGDKQVLAGVDLLIPQGSVAFIIGISGAGKSVLMKHLVGLIRADEGQILFEGTDVSGYSEAQFYEVRRRVSFVFQHSTLLDGLDVLDNVALAVEHRRGISLAAARARASTELARLHLEALHVFIHFEVSTRRSVRPISVAERLAMSANGSHLRPCAASAARGRA